MASLISGKKRISPKYLYDQRGSALFDAICSLPEYYPTRTEAALIEERRDRVAELAGPGRCVVEYGPGRPGKTLLLLDALEDPSFYVPIDVSSDALFPGAASVARARTGLRIRPINADFTRPIREDLLPPGPKLGLFLGSTVGNFDPDDASALLGKMAAELGTGGALLVGVDLKKDRETLERAYNDSLGVTAEFNLNLLDRMNRELGSDFDKRKFRHRAFYNEAKGRIEMHLESVEPQEVRVAGETVRFHAGETIHTESSYKYTLEGFAELAARAGLRPRATWTDSRELFSLHYLIASDRIARISDQGPGAHRAPASTAN